MLTPLSFRRGLPIGNLTSQFFANVYLNGFDHFVKETLNGHKYLRYVDDFALFSDDRAFLVEARQAMEDYLATLRLKVHPIKSQIVETCHGASFLGFRVLPRQIRVRSGSLKRARGRLKLLQARYAGYQAGIPEIVQSIQSWEAHLNHGNTWRLRRQIFNSLVFSRGLKKG
jgi:retron-type reverse transcriptase